MLFKDRKEAGIRLAEALKQYKDRHDVIILGLPRGGVVTAYEVAHALHVPLDVTCPKKIGAPGNPEYAVGSITETGQGVFNQSIIRQLDISAAYIQEEVAAKTALAKQRLSSYRKNRPSIQLSDKVVILVDDGLATGFTMRAAIQSVKACSAKKIVVAIPVSPPDTIKEIEPLVDEIVCLATPEHFYAVGQFYGDFDQTEDEEVIELLQRAQGGSDESAAA